MEIQEPKKKTIRNDEEYRKEYFRNYHKNSKYLDCETCYKKYRASNPSKHRLTKRHQEFEKLNLNLKLL
jgi:hypothetical protein